MLFLKNLPEEKEQHHAQKRRFHINRAFGCDFYYCAANGVIAACPGAGKEPG
jgi:hypothetical protein